MHLVSTEIGLAVGVAGYVLVPTIALARAPLDARRALCVIACSAAALFAPAPSDAAVVVPPTNGLLRTCAPITWACVSTQDDAPASFIEPWAYENEQADARQRLLAAVQFEGGTIDAVRGPYIRALFGDDEIEFYFTKGDYTIQLRADGVDHPKFDWGRNRARVERLRRKAGFESIPVLRGRTRILPFLESPLDEFAPSLPDGDALIDRIRSGERILDQSISN